jgi:transcription initiation factor TFIIIB Brf1 subunit/transcription initiation factor TFIIB
LCLRVVRKAEELAIISENTPPAVATGCIYMICSLCGIPLCKEMLMSVCDMSMVTVTKCYKKLYTYRMHILDDESIRKFNIRLEMDTLV